jgi:hypothetical protein
MTFKDTDIYFPRQELKIRFEGNYEISLYDRNTGIIHELNPTAAYIFTLIIKGNHLLDIIEKYKIQYDLEHEESKSDVLIIVKKFLKLNIISNKHQV